MSKDILTWIALSQNKPQLRDYLWGTIWICFQGSTVQFFSALRQKKDNSKIMCSSYFVITFSKHILTHWLERQEPNETAEISSPYGQYRIKPVSSSYIQHVYNWTRNPMITFSGNNEINNIFISLQSDHVVCRIKYCSIWFKGLFHLFLIPTTQWVGLEEVQNTRTGLGICHLTMRQKHAGTCICHNGLAVLHFTKQSFMIMNKELFKLHVF